MKILVVEDDERVASAIKRGLQEEACDVEVAYDGEVGWKLFLGGHYDLLIVDVILPKVNGLDLCKKIRNHDDKIPVIMLTALGRTDDKVEGFDAGADDYMVKPFEFRELMARIRALQKRTLHRPPTGNVLTAGDLRMNLYTKEVRRGDDLIELTPKEFLLLELLLQNKGRVVSKVEIAEKVWDIHFDTGTNVIDVYINYLRKKVDKKYEQKLIHTKVGMGFIIRA